MAEDHQLASLELSDPLEETVHHISARKRRGRDTAPPALSLTSMIDVIFLLLVYFVVTANFTKDEGVLKANLPGSDSAQAAPPPEGDPLIITIDPRGETGYTMTIENNNVDDFTRLTTLLAGYQRNPDKDRHGYFPVDHPVKIQVGDEVRWQHALAAFNAAAKVGYENVQMEPRKI